MRWRGLAAVATAASLWGVAGVVAKSLFAQGIAPGDLVEIRLTAGFALTCGIFWLRRRPMVLPSAAALRLIPLGVAMAVSQAAYYLTISLADVTTAIFLQYTAPALVLAYTTLVHREALTASQAAAVAGAVGGGYLLVVGPRGLAVPPAAVASGMASALGFAAWVLLGRARARSAGPWEMLLYSLGTSAILWSLLVPPWDAYLQPLGADAWGRVVFIVVAATVAPFALFLYGLRHLDSRTASLTATLEPVVAAAAAALLLGEVPGSRGLAGAGLILASVILVQVLPPAPGHR
jgi:drug/metabolite transporter (DMT)-like permease